jgi:hypothetical protein
MNTTASQNLVMLARMLERLDRSTVAVDPQQYRGVVEHLAEMLRAAPYDAAWRPCWTPPRDGAALREPAVPARRPVPLAAGSGA